MLLLEFIVYADTDNVIRAWVVLLTVRDYLLVVAVEAAEIAGKNSGRFSLIHFLKNKTENGSRQSASEDQKNRPHDP